MREQALRRPGGAHRARRPLALVAGALLLSACAGIASSPGTSTASSTLPSTAASPAPTASDVTGVATTAPSTGATLRAATPRPSAPHPSANAVVRPVPASEWARMLAVGAWHAGCPVGRAGLRRVEVSFHGFDGHVHRGVLVVNVDVATSVAAVFTELFDRGFPVHRMAPIEAYRGDDNASMAADNTSAYNCRTAAQSNAPAARSPHANGRAIDLNPYENPWIDPRCGCVRPDARYGHQRSGTGVITEGGIPWTAFTRRGWTWQDNTTTDFQHFDTGYPSHPLS